MNRDYLKILTRFCVLFTMIVSSCIPQKKLEYLQDAVTDKNTYELAPLSENLIRPNDELYIKASSFDDVAFNFFGNQGDFARTGFSNEISLNLLSYTVDKNGFIYFPVIGNIEVNGLSLDEARIKIESLLKEYFNQPTIIIKFAFKKLTIIGAVNNPGNYTYTKDRLNIFDALSMAGDLTIHGNRKKIYLIRANGQSVDKILVDLTKDKLFISTYYYLRSDDILYVTSRHSLKWDVISTPVSLILSGITTTLLVINFIQR